MRQTDRQAGREREGDRETETETERQRQRERERDRQRERERQRQRDREREREKGCAAVGMSVRFRSSYKQNDVSAFFGRAKLLTFPDVSPHTSLNRFLPKRH